MRLALVIVAALSTPVFAQPSMTEPAPVQPSAQPLELPMKTPAVATAVALGTTAAGLTAMYLAFREDKANLTAIEMVLAWGGFFTVLVGPSAGHIYAGEKKHAGLMFAVRSGAAVVFLGGWMYWRSERTCQTSCPSNDGKTSMWIGGGALAATALYDFYDAHRAAHRFNRKLRPLPPTFAPTLSRVGGVAVPGVAIAGTF